MIHDMVCLQAQQFSMSQNNLTADNMSALFEELFSKSVDKASVSEVFTEQWDEYRKVSCHKNWGALD